MLMMKFGGSSVADSTQIAKVIDIVRSRVEAKPVVVCSAHRGITTALVAAAKRAAAGDCDPGPVVERQRLICTSLGSPSGLLEPLFREIGDLLRGISLVKELSPRSLDYISSFGERMSVRTIADYFSRNGLPAIACDVWDLGFVTDSQFGCARPTEGFERRVQAAFGYLPEGAVPIVTGFIGKNENGELPPWDAMAAI